MPREIEEWSEWYFPKDKKPSLGAYVQVKSNCFWCTKERIEEGIVVQVDSEYYKLVPEYSAYCHHNVQKWRERIVKIEDDAEEETEIPENV